MKVSDKDDQKWEDSRLKYSETRLQAHVDFLACIAGICALDGPTPHFSEAPLDRSESIVHQLSRKTVDHQSRGVAIATG